MRHIGLGDLNIGQREKRYIQDVLDSNRLSYGRYTRAFEARFAESHACRYAVMCNSGTSALQIALSALKETRGWSDGDEVLVPAVTFIATSNVVLYSRMRPVFVDVDPIYYTIDPAKIEAAITPRTRAIIPVHLFGLPCDMDPILQIAKANRLGVIEDSAQAMFVRYRSQPVGSFGDLACFSTYVAHLLVTGVGGLVTTRQPDLAIICRSLMAHGRDSVYLSMDDDDDLGDENRVRVLVERRFSFERLGFSYRATEMEAALGLAQLEDMDSIARGHRENAAYLTERLRQFEHFLQLPVCRPESDHAFMTFPIVLKGETDREKLLTFLESQGIETRYMFPLINQPIYVKMFGHLEDRYPVAQVLNQKGFYIGCHRGLSRADLDYVVDQFKIGLSR